jgi:hypothetical protein
MLPRPRALASGSFVPLLIPFQIETAAPALKLERSLNRGAIPG